MCIMQEIREATGANIYVLIASWHLQILQYLEWVTNQWMIYIQ